MRIGKGAIRPSQSGFYPRPGGPQKIIECSAPCFQPLPQGRPGKQLRLAGHILQYWPGAIARGQWLMRFLLRK